MRKLEEVVDELVEDMKEGGWAGKTVTLKYKLDTFKGEGGSVVRGFCFSIPRSFWINNGFSDGFFLL